MYPPSHLRQQAAELIQIYLAVGSLLVLRRRGVGQFEGMVSPQGGVSDLTIVDIFVYTYP